MLIPLSYALYNVKAVPRETFGEIKVPNVKFDY